MPDLSAARLDEIEASARASGLPIGAEDTVRNARRDLAELVAEVRRLEAEAVEAGNAADRWEHEALTLAAQRRAVLDLCDDPLPRHWRDTAVVPIADVLVALGVPPA